MKLVKAWLGPYKSIREPTHVDFSRPLTSLVGPNNEGKSTILEAIRMMRYVRHDFGDTGTNVEQFLQERRPDKDPSIQFEIMCLYQLTTSERQQLKLADTGVDRIHVRFLMGMPGVPGTLGGAFPIDIHAVRNDESEVQIGYVDFAGNRPNAAVPNTPLAEVIRAGKYEGLSRAEGDGYKRALQRSQSGLPENFAVFGLIGEWCSNIQFVPSHRKAEPVSKINVGITPVTGSNLPAYLHHMQTNYPGRFRRFIQLIRDLVPSIREIHTRIEEGGEQVSIRVGLKEIEDTGQAFRLDTVGTGVAELMQLASAIWLSPPGSVLLIEEPERGLHPNSQRLLMRQATRHATENNKQIVWATHSTVLAPLSTDCSVLLVTLDSEAGTTVSQVTDGQAGAILGALGHATADLYGYDVVVLWDGDSEGRALPRIVNHMLGAEYAGSIKFESMHGDLRSRRDMIERIVRMLAANRTQVFIFADDDEGARSAKEDLIRALRSQGFEERNVYIWTGGFDASVDRKAEFEDNIAAEELINAANRLGGGSAMNVAAFTSRLGAAPSTKTSKVLSNYFREIYQSEVSKPHLAQILGEAAFEEIRKQEADRSRRYEFEGGIAQLRELLVRRN